MLVPAPLLLATTEQVQLPLQSLALQTEAMVAVVALAP
jgi:hypothetical protein